MVVIPIDVEPEVTVIRADRRLAFEVISAFRGVHSTPIDSIRVLERWDDDRLRAEFTTPVPLPFGISWSLRTVEDVTFTEPSQIEFILAEPNGILRILEDRFVLSEDPDGTHFRYQSRFGIGGWIFGWILGQIAIKPLVKSHMRMHTAMLKETIEERARRSRKYSQPHNSLRNGAAEGTRSTH